MHEKDWFDWFHTLTKDPSFWEWSHVAFIFGMTTAIALLLLWLDFPQLLIRQLKDMARESEQRELQERRRCVVRKEETEQEYQESKRCKSAQDAALKVEHFQRQIEAQGLSWLWTYFAERRHGSWARHDWHLHERMDLWERTAFDKRRWTKTDAAIQIKKYQRELERRERSYGRYRRRFHFCNLSSEEIHQRIDFLELQGSEKSVLPAITAKLRNAYAEFCNEQRTEEQTHFRQTEGLDSKDESEFTTRQRERWIQIIHYWDEIRRQGPTEEWLAEMGEKEDER